MSCPIPIRIVNPHYKKLSRDENIPLSTYDHLPDFYLDVPCGQCYNCLQSRGNAWSLRLSLEYNYMTKQEQLNSYFVTLTLDDKNINDDPSILIRRFLERIRKKYKRSIKHWIISEYGEDTNRLHFHGILFNIPFYHTELFSFWKYGFVTIKPLTPRRVGYVTTYVNKHLKKRGELLELPQFHQRIWCSPGLGKKVVEDKRVTAHMHVDTRPVPVMYNLSGRVTAIPRYLRKKFFTEKELEQLKTAYFDEQSEDVIPPPPYRIGNKVYEDYTLFLEDSDKLRKKRKYLNYKYKPKKESILCQTIPTIHYQDFLI